MKGSYGSQLSFGCKCHLLANTRPFDDLGKWLTYGTYHYQNHNKRLEPLNGIAFFSCEVAAQHMHLCLIRLSVCGSVVNTEFILVSPLPCFFVMMTANDILPVTACVWSQSLNALFVTDCSYLCFGFANYQGLSGTSYCKDYLPTCLSIIPLPETMEVWCISPALSAS